MSTVYRRGLHHLLALTVAGLALAAVPSTAYAQEPVPDAVASRSVLPPPPPPPASARTPSAAGATPSPALRAEAESAQPAAYTCNSGWFCWWSGLDAGGTGWVEYPAGCDSEANYLGTWRENAMQSIQNRTSYTVGIYNWTGSSWQTLWFSSPGNWGNLPASARRKADLVHYWC